ncbi:TonB-dependent receptor [uncultured Algimonas sp.]|uniref:TonB-dependent siderophore receptor n=1 Tax=uncultured Algimonas sp. TaxID=1547920 RepID=UPI00261F7361|nr:TonB-dependent receptor [uncultured Algimonas sp.]
MRPISYTALLLAGTSLLTFPLAVSAQVPGDAVRDEVVVTGLRQAYQGEFAPLEIPQVNQSIDEELLRDVGAVTLDDALDLSASVARQNNFGGLWNSFSIRGFSGDINLPSGFLVNGFNAGRGFAGPRDIVGIESVEVLKGPRSALYGRGEPGGTINLVTKRPTFETGGYVEGTIGSWDQYRFEADAQHSVSGEGGDLGFRFVGFYEDAESFRNEVETEKLGFYPSLTFVSPDAATTIGYELEYTEQTRPQDRGVIFSETFGFSSRRLFTGEPDALIETEVLGHRFEVQHDFSEDWGILLGAGYRKTSLFGDAYETNFGSRQPYLVDGQAISRFFRSRDYETDYFVMRGEITGEFDTAGLRHRLIAGIDYDRFENDQVATRFRQASIRGAASRTLDPQTYLLLDVSNPVYGRYARPDAAPQIDRIETLSGLGLYVQDQIDLTDRLQLRIGGRFDDFDQELDNRRRSPTARSESSNSHFSPQLGAVYAASDAVSLYASYGEGIRQLSGTNFEGTSFEPNRSKSAEIGLKTDLGRLFGQVQGSASLTLFQVDQSNILVFDTRPEAAGSVVPAGEARSRGLEFDANVSFEHDLSLWLSYAYTDGEYTNAGTDSSTFTAFEAGTPLVNSPDHQLSLQLSKGFELGGMAMELGGGALYVGDRSGELGTDFTLPDYLTMRVFGEIEPVENIAFRVSVDNLFDKTYYTDSFANVWVQPGAPRRFRVTARYSF